VLRPRKAGKQDTVDSLQKDSATSFSSSYIATVSCAITFEGPMVPIQTEICELQAASCTSAMNAGHRKEGIDSSAERAASRPSSCSSLFERRGRKGIAPLKMECVKPFKPRTDGKLCVLDAPATHIRLGSSVGIDGNRMLTCIDIHTLEYFLMHDKDAPKHHLPLPELDGKGEANSRFEAPTCSIQESNADGSKDEVSANMREAVGVLANICTQDDDCDGYSSAGLGSLISPCSSFCSEPSSPLALPAVAEAQSPNPTFILDQVEAETSHAHCTAPTTIPESDLKACLRLGVKRSINASPSATVVSPLTPCNVDAGPNLWTLRSAPIISMETAVVDSVRSEIEQEVVLKRRRL
jgi:hypothetical protein